MGLRRYRILLWAGVVAVAMSLAGCNPYANVSLNATWGPGGMRVHPSVGIGGYM